MAKCDVIFFWGKWDEWKNHVNDRDEKIDMIRKSCDASLTERRQRYYDVEINEAMKLNFTFFFFRHSPFDGNNEWLRMLKFDPICTKENFSTRQRRLFLLQRAQHDDVIYDSFLMWHTGSPRAWIARQCRRITIKNAKWEGVNWTEINSIHFVPQTHTQHSQHTQFDTRKWRNWVFWSRINFSFHRERLSLLLVHARTTRLSWHHTKRNYSMPEFSFERRNSATVVSHTRLILFLGCLPSPICTTREKNAKNFRKREKLKSKILFSIKKSVSTEKKHIIITRCAI